MGVTDTIKILQIIVWTDMLRYLQIELLLYGRRMNQINMNLLPTGSGVCVCVWVHASVCVMRVLACIHCTWLL